MLYEFAQNINSEMMLFKDHIETEWKIPDVIFRRRREGEQIFEHTCEPIGDYVLEKNGEVIATGGFMLCYNMPFSDLYMEVKENFKKNGLGSFLIQELKKECYLSGRIPAARCSISNIASRSTMIKAGLQVAGFMLTGECKRT